jgi:hypothetical protein
MAKAEPQIISALSASGEAQNAREQAHTQLTGSLIAATDTGDKDGNDNGQLSLTTNYITPKPLTTF